MANRRLISINLNLDTDETLFNFSVKWLYELDNPDNPGVPAQELKVQHLDLADMTPGDRTSLNATVARLGTILERKHPLVVSP